MKCTKYKPNKYASLNNNNIGMQLNPQNTTQQTCQNLQIKSHAIPAVILYLAPSNYKTQTRNELSAPYHHHHPSKTWRVISSSDSGVQQTCAKLNDLVIFSISRALPSSRFSVHLSSAAPERFTGVSSKLAIQRFGTFRQNVFGSSDTQRLKSGHVCCTFVYVICIAFQLRVRTMDT